MPYKPPIEKSENLKVVPYKTDERILKELTELYNKTFKKAEGFLPSNKQLQKNNDEVMQGNKHISVEDPSYKILSYGAGLDLIEICFDLLKNGSPPATPQQKAEFVELVKIFLLQDTDICVRSLDHLKKIISNVNFKPDQLSKIKNLIQNSKGEDLEIKLVSFETNLTDPKIDTNRIASVYGAIRHFRFSFEFFMLNLLDLKSASEKLFELGLRAAEEAKSSVDYVSCIFSLKAIKDSKKFIYSKNFDYLLEKRSDSLRIALNTFEALLNEPKFENRSPITFASHFNAVFHSYSKAKTLAEKLKLETDLTIDRTILVKIAYSISLIDEQKTEEIIKITGGVPNFIHYSKESLEKFYNSLKKP